MKTSQVLIIALATLILAGGSGFWAGIKYQQTKNPQSGNFNRMMVGGNFRQGNNGSRTANFRPLRGEILKTDKQSMTVKLNDGSSRIILLSDQTAVTEATSAGQQQLAVGQQVMVLGTENSDGSMSAQEIQLNPIDRSFFMGGRER